jgi:hypothetical protein
VERKILAALCQSRANWESIRDILQEQKWSPEGGIIYGIITQFYETDDNASSVDMDILIARISRRINSAKHIEVLTTIVQSLFDTDISGINVAQEVKESRAYSLGLEIASKLSMGKADATTMEKIAAGVSCPRHPKMRRNSVARLRRHC